MTDKKTNARLSDYWFALPQYLIPHHYISRITLAVTRIKTKWLKNAIIKWAIKHYKINVSEAADEDINNYPNFNAFFTRALKESARPIATGDNVLCCPVDGAVSQVGDIDNDTIFQAKGHHYSAKTLLGGYGDIADQFKQGKFATLYLSPRDYHRIHIPTTGTLRHMVYVPGRLFSVNPPTARVIPNVFARNERVIAIFDTAFGKMAVVMVGALNVACIETTWSGVVTPPHKQPIHRWVYDQEKEIVLNKGDEMGRFNMGSTVICLFDNPALKFDSAMVAEAPIKMGQTLLSR